jgi:hypothetical protein
MLKGNHVADFEGLTEQMSYFKFPSNFLFAFYDMMSFLLAVTEATNVCLIKNLEEEGTRGN